VNSGFLFGLKTLFNFFKSQVIIVGAGGIFEFEMPSLVKLLPMIVILAKLLCFKKIIYFSIGFYSDTPPITKKMALLSMKFADVVSVRDKASLKNVTYMLPLKEIYYIPYMPLYLKPIDKCLAEEITKNYIDEDKTIRIGLNARYYNDKVLNRIAEDKFSQIINEATKKLNVKFVFFPFDISTVSHGYLKNDYIFSERLRNRILRKDKFTIIRCDQHTPQEVKGMIGCMNLFISMRLTPLLLAYSMKVPSIAVIHKYSEKILSFANTYGIKTMQLNQLNVNGVLNVLFSEREEK
jgi:polysaccharide pyruvyl transferase WcaK-like protein